MGNYYNWSFKAHLEECFCLVFEHLQIHAEHVGDLLEGGAAHAPVVLGPEGFGLLPAGRGLVFRLQRGLNIGGDPGSFQNVVLVLE